MSSKETTSSNITSSSSLLLHVPPLGKKNHATIWIARLTNNPPSPDDDRPEPPDLEVLARTIQQNYPTIVAESQHGDMLEDSAVAGYRSEGVYMIARRQQQANNNPNDNNNNNESSRSRSLLFHVVRLEYGVDDYGSVSTIFAGISDFPLDYWHYDLLFVRNLDDPTMVNPRPASYWHTSPMALVKLGDKVYRESTNIRSVGQNLTFDFHGTEYTIHLVTSMERLFGYYNGFVYGIDSTTAAAEL